MSIDLQTLQETNRRLQCILQLLAAQECGPLQVSAEELSALTKELKIGESLAQSQFDAGPEAKADLAQYRHYLEQLRDALPRLQGRLLVERARLAPQRKHVETAQLWARSQETLHRR